MRTDSKIIADALRVLARKYLPPEEEDDSLVSGVLMEAADKLEELQEREAKLVEALKFYRINFIPYKQFEHLPGFAWKPSDELLEDCGNKAEETLKELGIE